ncbi:MAG: RNA polymerase sigma factor [Gemmatimonadota bacterium]|nr:RNA polymerase sigma factor [Gemmatimonadota bacterium]
MPGYDEQQDQTPLPMDPKKSIRILFDRYHSNIFNLCVRLLGNREDAEDITQDVFARAHNAYHRFRGDANPGTWLYRIAVNLSLNHQRREKRLRWVSLDVFMEQTGGSSLTAQGMLPGDVMERSEIEHIVQKAINRLPERQRVALILSRYEGLSYQQIAKTMDSTVPSVESLLHRAKLNLAKRLKPYMNDLRPG